MRRIRIARLIAASSSQNFYVETGGLEAELLAVDGKAVQPIRGNFFQLAVAQRLDLKVIIPTGGWRISDPRAGRRAKTALRSRAGHKGASIPKLSEQPPPRLQPSTTTQEKRLRAVTPYPIVRSTAPYLRR